MPKSKQSAAFDKCRAAADALACSIGTISAWPASTCKPRIVLLTDPACRYCGDAKQKYSADLAKGTVTEVAGADAGAIMDKNNLEYFPTLAVLDCNDRLLTELDIE